MSRYFDFRLGKQPVGTKLCVCGCPKGRHRKQWERGEDGTRRSVFSGPCQDTRCPCPAFDQRQETAA